MPGKGQPYRVEYSTEVTKSGKQTPVIDIYALRQSPGVVEKRKGQMVNYAGKSNRLPMKEEGRR